MTKRMPLRLGKAPIIDSVFEIRYPGSQLASAILPGVLHGGLPGKKSILPSPPIPIEIIMSDPNMRNVVTFSVEWDNYLIAGNPYFVAISYKPPYECWGTFKKGIAQIHRALFGSNIFSEINRYSIRYTDFIEEDPSAMQMNFLDIDIAIHKKKIKGEKLALQIELPDKDYMHIVKVATSAAISRGDSLSVKKDGLLIDTDTICSLGKPLSPESFMQDHDRLLDAIHSANKELFFKTLSQHGIECLEPEYA